MCCNHAITIITKTILYLFYYHWVLLISIFFGKELCKYKYKYSTSTVQGDKGFITNKISVSGTLPFVIIDELTEVFHRTTMAKCGKIRMTTVKIKKWINSNFEKYIEHHGFYLSIVLWYPCETNLFMKLCCQVGTEFVHSKWQVLKCPIFFVSVK